MHLNEESRAWHTMGCVKRGRVRHSNTSHSQWSGHWDNLTNVQRGFQIYNLMFCTYKLLLVYFSQGRHGKDIHENRTLCEGELPKDKTMVTTHVIFVCSMLVHPILFNWTFNYVFVIYMFLSFQNVEHPSHSSSSFNIVAPITVMIIYASHCSLLDTLVHCSCSIQSHYTTTTINMHQDCWSIYCKMPLPSSFKFPNSFTMFQTRIFSIQYNA